jgi:methionine-gamma-lyase
MRNNGIKMMNYIADHAYSITLAVSLGQIRTLIEHPAGMTHFVVPDEVKKSQGIDTGGIRLAIGIEPAEDIIRDLERALAGV